MTEFSLNGKTEEKDGKFAAIITLRTPDGTVTKLESGFVYQEKEAEHVLKEKIEEIIEVFKEDGVEILSRMESIVQ